MTRNTNTHQIPPTMPGLPLAAPAWALCSVPEPDRVTHETVSRVHPAVRWCGPAGWLRDVLDGFLASTAVPDDGRFT